MPKLTKDQHLQPAIKLEGGEELLWASRVCVDELKQHNLGIQLMDLLIVINGCTYWHLWISCHMPGISL